MRGEAVIPKLADIRGLDNYWMDMLRISRQALEPPNFVILIMR